MGTQLHLKNLILLFVKLHVYFILNPLRNSSKKLAQSLLPLRPCPFLVESEGIGVTSSILPILSPFLARALIADCAPGPGVLASTPPFPRTLMWMALIPKSFNSLQTSTAASIAAYGDDSSLSALTFIPPEMRE